MNKVLSCFLVTTFALSAAACGGTEPAVNKANTSNTAVSEKVCEPITDTATAAYKRLYAAVKAKDANQVKAEMSLMSQEFADSIAGRQNKPVESVYENGFTATTFSPTLPEIRDERINGCWAAVEVFSSKDNRWEDLPFVNEEGMWKFAVGELFSGSYKSPGKGRDALEQEAANTSTGNTAIPPGGMPNSTNSNSKTAPKYDGPQVEPIPKKP